MITRLSRSLGGPVIWSGTTVALPTSCAPAVGAPSAAARATAATTASLNRITFPLFVVDVVERCSCGRRNDSVPERRLPGAGKYFPDRLRAQAGCPRLTHNLAPDAGSQLNWIRSILVWTPPFIRVRRARRALWPRLEGSVQTRRL